MTATYRSLEGSRSQGRPMELYHFFRGTEDWFYTSSKFVIVFEGDVYEPLEITRSTIDLGGEDKPGAITVRLPTDSDLGALLQAGTSPTPISLQITRIQRDALTQPAIIFIGELSTADDQDEMTAVQALPFLARLDFTIPQGLFQRRQCHWNTFDTLTCKAVKATFTYTGEVTAISGVQVTVDGAVDFDPGTGTRVDMFALGIIQKGEWQGMIESQSGNVLTLIERVPTLEVGDEVQLIAGDDRTPETCRDKFGKIARYLAFPDMPVVDPYSGQGLRP